MKKYYIYFTLVSFLLLIRLPLLTNQLFIKLFDSYFFGTGFSLLHANVLWLIIILVALITLCAIVFFLKKQQNILKILCPCIIIYTLTFFFDVLYEVLFYKVTSIGLLISIFMDFTSFFISLVFLLSFIFIFKAIEYIRKKATKKIDNKKD